MTARLALLGTGTVGGAVLERLERLQQAAHGRARPACAFGYSGHPAEIARQQLDDEAGLLEWVGMQHVNRLVILFSDSGHMIFCLDARAGGGTQDRYY